VAVFGWAARSKRAARPKLRVRKTPRVSHPFRAQQTTAFTIPASLFQGVTLVVQLLTARQRDLDLGASLRVEIQLQRNHRESLPLDRADQLVDLALVQQQLARPLRRMIVAPGLRIFRDVGVDQPEFAGA
jgi:hypothetical protein